jgi:superfamily II DNA/RNA helicase
MTDSPLDFGGLSAVLEAWPDRAPPTRASDGVFDRVRQILTEAHANGVTGLIPDLAPLLKHVLRRETCRTGAPAQFRVPIAAPWPDAREWARYGVSAHSETTTHALIEGRPFRPDWFADHDLPVFDDAFAECPVRRDWSTPIDPFLGERSGFTTYVTPGQREAVRSAFLVPPGETLVICLPTGSGKSFVAQAPVLARGLEGGLCLCIVPTTALAIDQARQTLRMLAPQLPTGARPILAWRSGLSAEEKAEIKSAIREGRQGILYCSPEAMTGALLPSIYIAARAGLLDYLVIDEAHLVSQWGDGFRPAFQMVAGIRRGLLRECPGPGFRTILMSATLTAEAVDTIDTLFGPPEAIQMVSSVHIRPEPQYWMCREDDDTIKQEKVLEAIRHAPRPVILYVTKRADARAWCKRLKAAGHQRVEMFHGETPDADRDRIIGEWARNEIDVVVATSAFGVGIDKSDVRTVIHAAVPETVDRFYQEVGRGGRDGATSGSLLIYSNRDLGVAERIGTPSLISEDLAFERWDAMVRNARPLDEVGLRLEVSLATVPKRLRQQTEYNAAWNMRTIILMARAGMLELDASAPELLSRDDSEDESAFEERAEAYWSDYYMRCIVDVHEAGHRDQATFTSRIQDERLGSFAAANENAARLKDLISGEKEIGSLLKGLYQRYAPGRTVVVSMSCGGCPAHRRDGVRHVDYVEPAVFGIERIVEQNLEVWRASFPHLARHRLVFLVLPEPIDLAIVASVLSDAVSLFNIKDIGVSNGLRAALPELASLHKKAEDPFVMIQDISEEAATPTQYPVARISVATGGYIPPHLLELERPLHIVVAAASMPDPWHPGRRIGDVGVNTLTLEQFRSGSRL